MYGRMRDRFLLLRDGAKNVTWPRDVREINLCFDLFLSANGTGRFC
jgi:hypothetical protein